eukprot:SAG31_NODE_48091_length_199_cov_31.690000_1_plen_23_part_10
MCSVDGDRLVVFGPVVVSPRSIK